jgi:predicted double-glycine peptidase
MNEWFCVPSYVYDKQDTCYTCGPSSLCMALSELKIHKTETELAKLMNTTTNGTGHEGFFQAMKSLKLKSYHKNFKDVGWNNLATDIANPQVAVIIHGMCKGWPTYYKQYHGGHYIYPIGVNMDQEKIRVADPSKGVIEYSFNEFKNGMDLISQPSLLYILL